MPGAFYRTPPSGRRERPKDNASLSFGSEPASNSRVSPVEEIRKTASGKASGRPTAEGRAWELRLTPSMLVMAGVLTLVTLCFFFLFGLIIGRGSVPPPPSPALERLVHDEGGGRGEEAAPERILPEEDLRFMTDLKNDQPEENSGSGPATTAKPAGESAPPSKTPAAPSPDKGQYDFVLRVAAFKSEDQADALRAKLEGAGMRTRMTREKAQKGTWYFVHVLYRGTKDNMEAMRATLADFGIRDSIVSSTTPAN